MGALPSNAVGIEVDADPEILPDQPHVSPESIEDPVATLRLAVAYLELLEAVASEHDQELALRGIQVVDKCTAVFARVDSTELARMCALKADVYLNAHERAPRGLRSRVQDVHDARAKLSPMYKATAIIGSDRRELLPIESIAGFPAEALAVRARPMRIGGKSPTVTFESLSEQRQFTLRASVDLAKQLAGHLYAEVDIEALVLRANDGMIEGGTLDCFFPLDADDPLTAWGDFVGEGLNSQ